MKYIKLFEELTHNKEVDGSQYFDFNSIEMNGSFENPIYFMLSKSEKYSLIYISPEEYLKQVAKGFKTSVEDTLKMVSMPLVDRYVNNMKNGDKFPIGFFIVGSSHQEGRHRAVAMQKLGVTKFPIVKIENLTRKDRDEIALSFKGLTSDEIDIRVKEMGYRGASDLDKRTIKNYLEYSL